MNLTAVHKNRLKRIAWKLSAMYAIDPKNCYKGVEVCKLLQSHGFETTMGKFSQDGLDTPEEIVRECRQSSTFLKQKSAFNGFYLSIKPPALDFNLKHIKNIATVARENGHGIHFDSHDYALAGPTLELLKKTIRSHGANHRKNCPWQWGLTLPSRWKRSLADMRWAIKNNVRIRLVKGEFKADSLSDEMNPNQGFLTLIENLAGIVSELAIATHDHQLAKEAIRTALGKGTRVQLELLFGMPAGRMIALAKETRVPIRFYVAYGGALMLYGIRHLLTNPQKIMRPHLHELCGGYKSKISTIIGYL